MYKIKNNLAPSYLCNLHPMLSHNTQNYNLRRNHQVLPLRSRTAFFHNSFLLSSIRDWNSLPFDIVTANSIHIFKNKLKKTEEVSTKRVYSLGHGYSKTIHTRLRLGLSGLNSHLFKYNLSHNKYCNFCPGNRVENSEHYLLKCDQYTNARTFLLLEVKRIICPDINISLLRDLCPTYLTQILLEGSDDLTVNINSRLFECVYRYIKMTKRFEY